MDLILLTIGYPHPRRDVFVGNEMDFLCGSFDRVFIIPVQAGRVLPKKLKNGDEYTTHQNIKVFDIAYNFFDVFLINPRILWLMLKETVKVIRIKKPIKYKILYLWMIFRWTFITNIVQKNIKRLVKDQKLDAKNTILYSYWFHFLALSIALQKNTFALKVSRAHGSDLYEEAYPQPCKNFVVQNLDAIFACSKMGADYINKRYSSKKALTSYLGTFNEYPVDLDKSRKEVFKIVSCARLVPIKRIHKIVEALGLINEHNILWTHIGDGELFEEVKAYAEKKLGEKNNIQFRFAGFMPNQKILELYSKENFNIFVNTSQSEGLPVSIMEALSSGIPVIATNVGGVSEIVFHGENGFLIDENFSCEQLAKLIVEFIEMDDNEYHKFCKNARKSWEENFNAKKNYTEFVGNILNMAKKK